MINRAFTAAKTKPEILASAHRLRSEIRQAFVDADHWNTVNAAYGIPLDPDPDGSLRRWETYLNKLIAELEAEGGIP